MVSWFSLCPKIHSSLFGGNIIVTPLQFVIDGIKGCVYIIQQSVDAGSFRRTSGGFACLTVPKFGLNVQLGIETACHTVNRDTDENRVTAIDILLVLFTKKRTENVFFINSLFRLQNYVN